MQSEAVVEVEVVVPCTEGQEHSIRLRIVSWDRWEVAYTPCEALLGRAFGLMAPCSYYVYENRNRLRWEVLRQLARVGARAVPLLIEALGDADANIRRTATQSLGKIDDPSVVPLLIWILGDNAEQVRRVACQALGRSGDVRAVPALRVHAEVSNVALHALQQLGQADYPLAQAVQELVQQGLWAVLLRAADAKSVHKAIVQLGTLAVPLLIEALENGDSLCAAQRRGRWDRLATLRQCPRSSR